MHYNAPFAPQKSSKFSNPATSFLTWLRFKVTPVLAPTTRDMIRFTPIPLQTTTSRSTDTPSQLISQCSGRYSLFAKLTSIWKVTYIGRRPSIFVQRVFIRLPEVTRHAVFRKVRRYFIFHLCRSNSHLKSNWWRKTVIRSDDGLVVAIRHHFVPAVLL